METVGIVALFVAGVALVVIVLDSALRTFVLPRGVVVRLTRVVSVVVRRLFDLRLHWAADLRGARPGRWRSTGRSRCSSSSSSGSSLVLAGFTMMFVAVEGVGWKEAFIQSGSSMFTLGFEPPIGFWAATLGFVEAGDRARRCSPS